VSPAELVDRLDAAIMNGDTFHCEPARTELLERFKDWTLELQDGPAMSEDFRTAVELEHLTRFVKSLRETLGFEAPTYDEIVTEVKALVKMRESIEALSKELNTDVVPYGPQHVAGLLRAIVKEGKS